MAFPPLIDVIAWYAIFLFSTVCHEAAHATVAWRLGDPTAAKGGQVSLDPRPHIRREPIGMVFAPLIFLFMGGGMLGWASTPYDARWAAAYPRRAGWMALAGPATNFSLCLLAAAALRLGLETGAFVRPLSISMAATVAVPGGGWAEGASKLLSILFSLNLLLAFFNLIPFPPMDGSGLFGLILPGRASLWVQAYFRRPLARFAGMLLAWYVFPLFFGPLYSAGLKTLYWGLPLP
jgi:Zn-dependent protease